MHKLLAEIPLELPQFARYGPESSLCPWILDASSRVTNFTPVGWELTLIICLGVSQFEVSQIRIILIFVELIYTLKPGEKIAPHCVMVFRCHRSTLLSIPNASLWVKKRFESVRISTQFWYEVCIWTITLVVLASKVRKHIVATVYVVESNWPMGCGAPFTIWLKRMLLTIHRWILIERLYKIRPSLSADHAV